MEDPLTPLASAARASAARPAPRPRGGSRSAWRRHGEDHRFDRIGWLRAAVLGANDGIVSTASLMLGVAAAHATASDILVTGVAGLVAGAMSMAAGEYVSVHSQADTEAADLARERTELADDPAAETRELTAIYVGRGLTPALAHEVAVQLMQRDALGAHARDELGITPQQTARPLQAAVASALSFALGALLPLGVTVAAMRGAWLMMWLPFASLLCLAVLGAVAARAGGANPWLGAWRVGFWGAMALGLTAGAGAFVGAWR